MIGLSSEALLASGDHRPWGDDEGGPRRVPGVVGGEDDGSEEGEEVVVGQQDEEIDCLDCDDDEDGFLRESCP